MTDVAFLKSKIAEFAGPVQLPPSSATGPVDHFLGAFAGSEFDAIHLCATTIRQKFGTTDDLMDLAQGITQEENTEPTMFVCSADQTPEYLLFVGAHGDDAVILRTRCIALDLIIEAWRKAFWGL